mmetsp:Transcript_85434/g.160900  ORF Transcript_85434/g.160900 Transcript_85434/m.160900 type:complete len:425 (-) Transcript_85434:96-1370(-)
MAADAAADAAADPAAVPSKGLNAQAAEFQPGGWAWTAPENEKAEGWEELAEYLRGGFYNEELGWWMPYYLGKLKSFNMRTGYGFLECKQTHDIYRTDVYIHKSQMVMPFTIGQPVEFAVTQNSRGQPQAADVQWLPTNLPRRQQAKPSQAAPAPGQQDAGGSGSSSSARPQSRHMGMIKSYSAQQGYGFIQSDDVSEQHRCDVYLDRGQLPPTGEWRPGHIVEFEITYNHRGQPQARSVNWDPVPTLPRPAAEPSRGQTPGMALGAVGAKTEGSQGMRNLNKLQAHFRNGEMPSAIKTALDLQRNAESNDYVSFVLDRLGPPEEACTTLDTAIQLELLIGLSELLTKNAFPVERNQILLAWCEAIIPSLRPADGTNEELPTNVIAMVQENLTTAKALALQTEAFTHVLESLQKVSSSRYERERL